MRKTLLIILGLLVIPLQFLLAQAPKIISYQYWFDDNYTGNTNQSVTPASILNLNSTVDVSGLPAGLHRFNIRFKDDSLHFSQVSSSIFYQMNSVLISGYEYWFDNNFANKTTVNVANTQLLDLTAVISATSITQGLHVFHIRFKNATGRWCSVQSETFYKHGGTGNQNKLTSYEYWFDDNPAGKVLVPLGNQTTANVVAPINALSVQPGLHKVHIRFNSEDQPSIVSTSYFYKSGTPNIAENKISGYRFWFDNDPANMRVIALAQPVSNVILLDSVELPYLPLGKHLMNVDFRDTLGSYSSIVSDSVDVQNCLPYQAKAITGSTQICKGTNGVVYSTAAITNATGYSWNLPAGATIVSGANTRTITVNYALNAVTGLITVSGTNPCGIGTDNSLLVNLNPLPVPVITPNGPTTFCQGGSVTLTASGGTDYLWSNSATTAAITANASGTYGVTVTNANGCKNATSRVVTVNPLPTAVITPNGPTTFCSGGSVVLTASGGTSYLWSNTASTAAVTVTASGSYGVTVTNANGCKNTASRGVTVNPLPTALVTPNGPTTFCAGGSVVLTASGGTSYLWSNAAMTAAITVTASDTYIVTVTNSNGCNNSTSRVVTVIPLPPSTRTLASIIVPEGQTLCSDATDTLVVPQTGMTFLVQNGGSAVLISGQIIRVLPGADVNAGGYLHAYISSDCFYCNAIPHTLPQAYKEDPLAGNAGVEKDATSGGNFFRVYPNPTSGSFTLESNSPSNLSGTVEIYGMQGEKLISKQLAGRRKYEFSLQGKPIGIYIIRVLSEGTSGIARIIKY